jgi:anaerobic magnesium-protoporphyrin IX monomethyl ester cyclase
MNFGTFSLAVLSSAVNDIASIEIIDATNNSVKKAVKEIAMKNPDVVGVTAMGLKSVVPVCEFIEALRQEGFKGQLVAGGHGASMLPKVILEKGADAVVYGEGELTFREILCQGISHETKGLFLLSKGCLIKTPKRDLVDIENLKAPARNLSRIKESGVFLLETSRGCPHSCLFCETSRFFGCTWRGRSPEKVVDDIHTLVESEGAAIIQIADDNFTANPDRILKICKLLTNKKRPLFFLFSARSDDLTANSQLIPALAKAGFLRATVGVETVVPEIAQSIGKPISFNQHKKAFETMQKANIFTVASFIVGLPSETEQMRKKYVEFALELADSATFLPFQPFPGTPLEQGSGEPEEWCVKYAAKLTLDFRRHPKSIQRLLKAAKNSNVRGMLARASLHNRLTENILDEAIALEVKEALT